MNQVQNTVAQTMSSREIAELVEKRHDNVKRTIETLVERGVIASPQIEEKPTTGRPAAEYVFSGERGKRDSIIVVAQLCPEFTARLVDRWQELEARIAQPAIPAQLSRLQLIELAMQAEQERLALEVKATALEAKVTEQAPKVEALDRITIADGRLNLTNTAKNLDIQPHKLTKWMNENHWIYRRVGGGGWVAYQDKIQSGYLTHKIYVATREDGTEKTCEQVMVLPKGLAKLSMLVPVGGGRPPQGDLGLGAPAQ